MASDQVKKYLNCVCCTVNVIGDEFHFRWIKQICNIWECALSVSVKSVIVCFMQDLCNNINQYQWLTYFAWLVGDISCIFFSFLEECVWCITNATVIFMLWCKNWQYTCMCIDILLKVRLCYTVCVRLYLFSVFSLFIQ